uniref:Sulfhydryl oxidase n=1 Tax=Globodera rostochiensis TaxID=31243 RepID=A0A914HFY4_GLORO
MHWKESVWQLTFHFGFIKPKMEKQILRERAVSRQLGEMTHSKVQKRAFEQLAKEQLNRADKNSVASRASDVNSTGPSTSKDCNREQQKNSRLQPEDIPENSKQFSKFQLERLIGRNNLNAELEKLKKDKIWQNIQRPLDDGQQKVIVADKQKRVHVFTRTCDVQICNNAKELNRTSFDWLHYVKGQTVDSISQNCEILSAGSPSDDDADFINVSDFDGDDAREILELAISLLFAGKNKEEDVYADCHMLLTLLGIPFIQAPAEAEAQCVELERLGLVDGIVTDDSDVWLFGGRSVYRNMFSRKKHLQKYCAGGIDQKFGLRRCEFIQLGMLAGGDYSRGLEQVGIVSALELMSEFVGQASSIGDELERALFSLKCISQWLLSGWNGYSAPESTRKIRLRRVIETNNSKETIEKFPNDEVFEAYAKPRVDSLNKKFHWNRIDFDKLENFIRWKLGLTLQSLNKMTFGALEKWNAFIEQNTQFQVKITEFARPNDAFRGILDLNPKLKQRERVRQALGTIKGSKLTTKTEVRGCPNWSEIEDGIQFLTRRHRFVIPPFALRCCARDIFWAFPPLLSFCSMNGSRRGDLFSIFLLLLTFLVPSKSNDRPTLYGPADNVLELDVNSFDSTVYRKPMAFFVEFYSSWCGHCIEYKPHFVRFATMVKNWRNAVVVAVFNCADEINAPICREHAIDAFPTLKYFHVNAKGKDDAVLFEEDKRNLPLVASKIAHWAKMDFDKGIAPESWPKLRFEPSDSSLSDLWSAANKNAHLLGVIVDKEPATEAYSLMLNYAGDLQIALSLCSSSHSQIVGKFAGTNPTTPALIVFSRLSADHPIYTSADNSTPIESWIEMQRKLDELLEPYPKSDLSPLESLRGTKTDVLQQGERESAPTEVNWNQFEVQYLDLISAFHYLFSVEVPRNPVLGNTELTALKRFVHLLRLHGPGSTPVRRLFYRLDEWLSTQHQPVVVTDKYLSTLEQIQSDLGHPIPSNTSFMACRGSKPYLRGVQRTARKSDCEVCSKNFDKMAQEDGLLSVHRSEDVVLWLWRGHNKVNRRLKGEASEDPYFQKQQFPPPKLCSECRDSNGGFDERKVLQFLIKYYSDIRTDNYKPLASYTVKEFANGKVEKVANRRLNPKFEPMAAKIDNLDEIESRIRLQQEEGGFKHQWKSIDDDFGGTPNRAHFQFVWLGLFAIALFVVYFKYRQNRSKFWKTFYYMNDYKVFCCRKSASSITPTADKKKYSV